MTPMTKGFTSTPIPASASPRSRSLLHVARRLRMRTAGQPASRTPECAMPGLVSGFTLIETLVAIAILSVAVTAPLFTADRALVAAEIARDQLTASYLAQEGVEYVRAMRDDAYLHAYKVGGPTVSTDAWNDFLTGSSAWSITNCYGTGVTCTLDPANPMGTGSGLSLQPCVVGSTCGPLYLANGIYTEKSGISGSTKTPFTRVIQVLAPNGTSGSFPDKQVTSTVTWSFHGTSHTVSVSDQLTPWQ